MKKIIFGIITSAMFMLSTAQQIPIKTNGNQNVISTPKIVKLKFSFGLDEGIPVGMVSKYSSFVMGASFQGEYLIRKDLGVTLSANYLYFLAKDGGSGLSMVPVIGGLNFYVTPKIFLSGELGTSFYAGDEADKSVERGYLTYSQGVGYKFSKRLNVVAKYQGINIGSEKNYSFIGLRFAYVLPVKKFAK